MRSEYFCVEFLVALMTLLESSKYDNPAISALEYTLTPDIIYPYQLGKTVAGYNYFVGLAETKSKVCIAGDSPGATLVLSIFLYLQKKKTERQCTLDTQF